MMPLRCFRRDAIVAEQPSRKGQVQRFSSNQQAADFRAHEIHLAPGNAHFHPTPPMQVEGERALVCREGWGVWVQHQSRVRISHFLRRGEGVYIIR